MRGPGWLKSLDATERATCGGCLGARLFDTMDAQVYALALPSILIAFHLTKAQAGFLGTATGLGAAATASFAGIAADRFGRLPVMRCALCVAAIATLLLAFAQTFWTFALLRGIQGIAYGAELVASMTLVTEVVREGYRARAAAAVQSGHALGAMLALVAAMAVGMMDGAPQTWRLLFAVGLVPVIYAMVLPRIMPESRAYLAMQHDRQTQAAPSIAALVAPRFLRSTLLTGLVGMGVFGAAQMMMVWLPIFLHTELHYDLTSSATYLALNIAGAAIGPWIYGPLSDRLGRKTVFMGCLVLQSVLIAAFIVITADGLAWAIIPFIVLLGCGQGALAIGIQPIVAELYPTVLRARAMGLNTSLIRGAAALLPGAVGVLAMAVPLGWAMAITAGIFYALAMICLMLIPETHPQPLPLSRQASLLSRL